MRMSPSPDALPASQTSVPSTRTATPRQSAAVSGTARWGRPTEIIRAAISMFAGSRRSPESVLECRRRCDRADLRDAARHGVEAGGLARDAAHGVQPGQRFGVGVQHGGRFDAGQADILGAKRSSRDWRHRRWTRRWRRGREWRAGPPDVPSAAACRCRRRPDRGSRGALARRFPPPPETEKSPSTAARPSRTGNRAWISLAVLVL